MKNPTKRPTPYRDINKIVLALLERSQKILDKNIFGMYLHGSLATGTFELKKGSDIDFVIVHEGRIQENTIPKIREMLHEMIYTMPLAKKLEGSYVPKDWFSLSEPPKGVRPYINEGKLHLSPYGYEWILEKWLIRSRGITVFGPPPDTFIKPIPDEDIKRANIKNLITNWKPLLTDSDRLKEDNYQVYAVLTMCRASFLHINKKFPSKQEASTWAKGYFPYWKDLIDSASKWSLGEKFDQLEKVKEFIRFTCEFVQSF